MITYDIPSVWESNMSEGIVMLGINHPSDGLQVSHSQAALAYPTGVCSIPSLESNVLEQQNCPLQDLQPLMASTTANHEGRQQAWISYYSINKGEYAEHFCGL